MKVGSVKNPLLLAVGLGLIAGAIPVMSAIGVTSPSALKNHSGDITSLLSLIVFPATISFLAKRRFFWWGFVPSITTKVFVDGVDFVRLTQHFHVPLNEEIGWILSSLPIGALVIVAGVVVSSGSISLVRYIIQRRRRLTIEPEDVASVESANKEGAWPSPPAVE